MITIFIAGRSFGGGRAWQHFNRGLDKLDYEGVKSRLRDQLSDPEQIEHRAQSFDFYAHQMDMPWNLAWSLIGSMSGRHWISPAVNLITNLGFGASATHTTITDDLLAQPKRTRAWSDDGATPAEWFVAALGDHAGPFAVSLTDGPGPRRDAAEAEIAAASDFLLHSEGGIIHYRNHWPDDPYLRLWTGLALAQRGDAAHAGQAFQAAATWGVRR